VNVINLCPWVCKYFKFPVGHLTIHLECGDVQVMLVKGLVRCTVLPPWDLYHPWLPYRSNNRLIFCLCRTCAECRSQEQCHHETVFERALSRTWVVDELRQYVERGYCVIKTYEFYEYEVIQYDPKTRPYEQYINMFHKLKAEASCHPSWVQRPGDQHRYIPYFRDS
jgi:hypothetical protein